MFNRIPTVVLLAFASLSGVAGWPTPSAAECAANPTALPRPIAEQAARVRAELVAAALADLKPERLAHELQQARARSSDDNLPGKRLAMQKR